MTESIYNTNVSWADKIYRKSITFEEPLEVGEEYLLTVNSGKIHNLDIFDSGELIGSLRNNELSFVAERETDTLILRYYEHVDPISWKITLERKHETPSGLNYAKEYQLTKALDPEQRYMITVEATSVDKLGVWLGREYFAGYMEDNSLIVTGFDKAYDSIVIKSSSRNTRIDTVMMTRGVKFEDWLPTPEDTDNRFSLIKQTVDEIIHRVGDNEDNISEVRQTARDITQTVRNNKTELESQIKQTAEDITQTVTDTRRDLNSRITQTASDITSMVRDNKRDLQSEIKQTADRISTRVSNNRNDISKVDIKADNISARVSNNRNDISKVSIKADSISARVSNNRDDISRVNIEAGRISTRVSDNSGRISGFEQTARNIRIRLTDVEDNPISGINLSREGAQIHGDKIDLQGLVTIWNKDGSSRTQIDGDKITTGTIHGNKITANTIHGNRIRAGTISASKIGTGLLVGNTIRTSDRVRNYIHMREQMLTFVAGAWEKMEIGFDSADGWNEEPFIRMGVGDHLRNDVFRIEKNVGYTDLVYKTSHGYSRLKMKLNGNVELRAGNDIEVYGTLKTRSREIIDASFSSSSLPNIKIPAGGELKVGSDVYNRRDVVRIRDNISGASRSLGLPGLEGYVTGMGANLNISNAWHVRRVSSAKKYKRDIEPLGLSYAEDFFYNAQPIWYRSRGADNPEHSFYGYLADDVAKIDPRLVQYTSYGEVEGLSYDRVPALLHKVMLKQSDRIVELESKVDAIFNKLKNS